MCWGLSLMADKQIISDSNNFDDLVSRIHACRLCELPLGPNPVVQLSMQAKILIVGQAPGIRVHQSGVPFDDPSGDRLRRWMNIDKETFYDASKVAILPMGFCYPGTGKSGDLAPKPLCAETWRSEVMSSLGDVELTLVIGQYAQTWHLELKSAETLTSVVKNWRRYDHKIMPLPHPSPRNNRWLKTNPWFEQEVIPELQSRVSRLIC